MPTFLDVPGQHGHHRAVTQATIEAFHRAGDKAAFPAHETEGLAPWQPAKLYLPAWSGGGAETTNWQGNGNAAGAYVGQGNSVDQSQATYQLGSVVESRAGDLAFRRYSIVAGVGAGIRDLGDTRFDDVRTVPPDGYSTNEERGEPRNPAIASWYDYGFFTHVLSPKPHVWAVRTADGRYAKMQIVGYYCPGARPGCLTFRYVYQGDGSTHVEAPSGRVSWQSTRSR